MREDYAAGTEFIEKTISVWNVPFQAIHEVLKVQYTFEVTDEEQMALSIPSPATYCRARGPYSREKQTLEYKGLRITSTRHLPLELPLATKQTKEKC